MAQRQSVQSVSETTGHFLDTLRVLVAREFRMRYKGSFFGILWAVITPLGTVVVLQFLFTKVLNTGVPHFAAFLYCGILPWTWFQASVLTGSTTLNDNRDLVRTPFFSKPLLPWTVTCTNFIFYLFSFPVLVGLMVYERLPFTNALLVLPLVWIVQWILTLAFAVLMAAIGIMVRDWPHLIGVILLFWFYLTPIFYEVKQLPPDTGRWFAYNPLTAIITAHRSILIQGEFPDWGALGSVAVVSAALLAFSLFVFRTLEDSFIDKA
jgi:lipopolysaccharide transport system permease protein